MKHGVMMVMVMMIRFIDSETIIKSLPGFNGDLPFRLQTGYVGVEQAELFYYFLESEKNPVADPLLLWLTGGPGCSAASALFYEIGPLTFDFQKSTLTLLLNQYSWTKFVNMIFVDAPVGTGFSYGTSSASYFTGDVQSVDHLYQFLRNWLTTHPRFRNNRLYIAGDSYSGITVPLLLHYISEQPQLHPKINLQGYVLGNPATDLLSLFSSRLKFAHRVAIVSDELYESTKRNCKDEFVNVDPTNLSCNKDIQLASEFMVEVYTPHILEPKCLADRISRKPNPFKWDPTFFHDTFIVNHPPLWCRNDNYVLCHTWANDEIVRQALHVRQGTIKEWERCNSTLSYTYNAPNVVNIHKNLFKRGYRVLVYSGDHDMIVPYVDTMTWLQKLNLSISEEWRAWLVEGQVAGYSTTYSYNLTFATVKGGGHTAPEYRPKESYEMASRWFATSPL